MPRPIYLHHAVRMTDGGVGPPIPAGTDVGWGVLVRPYPSIRKKKNDFSRTNGGTRRTKVATPSHHKDRATVHGRVETQDTKGSTWISKDVR
jgi:hypothetical protein